MSILLYAQPYDVSAEGFYFRDVAEFHHRSTACRNSYGDPVEEFEIQFIDGGQLDCELAEAVDLNQANFAWYLDCADEWDEFDKITVILAVGQCGYRFEATTDPQDFDIDVYRVESLRALAEQFVDDDLFGDIPERLAFYIDYDAIAHDLACDYSEAVIAGERLIYRCG